MISNLLNVAPIRFKPANSNQKTNNNSTLKLAAPLKHDTVSFSSREEREATANEAGEIANKIVIKAQSYFRRFDAMAKRILGKNFENAREKQEKSVKEKIIREAKNHKSINVNVAMNNIVTDLLGARGVTDGSEKSMTQIIDNLCKEVEAGNCEITEIRNYRGKFGNEKQGGLVIPIIPYLKGEHVSSILKAHSKAGTKDFSIKVCEKTGKSSKGYTAAHLLGKMDGIPFEIQIKGKKVKQVDDGTHILHDLTLDKTLNPKVNAEIKDIQDKYKILKKNEKASEEYESYIAKTYQAARNAELGGHDIYFPDKPHSTPDELRIENLIRAAREAGLT